MARDAREGRAGPTTSTSRRRCRLSRRIRRSALSLLAVGVAGSLLMLSCGSAPSGAAPNKVSFILDYLPGAVHLPLKKLDASTAGVLDRERPVIVYCWDSL